MSKARSGQQYKKLEMATEGEGIQQLLKVLFQRRRDEMEAKREHELTEERARREVDLVEERTRREAEHDRQVDDMQEGQLEVIKGLLKSSQAREDERARRATKCGQLKLTKLII